MTTTIVQSGCDKQPDVNNENLYFLKDATQTIETDKIIDFYSEVNLKVEKIQSTGQRNYTLNGELIYFGTDKNCDIVLRRYKRFLILLKSHYTGEIRPATIIDFKISEMFIFNIDSNSGYSVSFSKPIKLMFSKCEYNWRYSDDIETDDIRTHAIEGIDFDKETLSLLKGSQQIEAHNLIKIAELPVDCGINN